MHGHDYCIPEDVVPNVLPVCDHRSLLAGASDQQDLHARWRHGDHPPPRAAGSGDRAKPGVKTRTAHYANSSCAIFLLDAYDLPMPDQASIDAVAHYAEAAIEIRLCPFGHEDFRQATLTTRGSAMSAKLADDQVLARFLFPFRRIWMQEEPSNFNYIRNILWIHAQEGQTRAMLAMLHERFRQSCSEWFPEPANSYGLTPRDLVDLMLNTRYAHVGGAAKKNRFTRTDLERHEAKVGAPKLEWLFQTTIDSISLTFAMMGDFALSALDHWARNGAGRPSFMLSSPYPLNELEIELKPLPRIERSTPGWTRTNESDADRMRRYLRRHCFRNISTFLDLLCLSDVDVLAQLRGSCNTSALIAKAGFRPEHYATLGEVANDPDGQRFSSCLCMQTGQKGFLCLTKHGVLRVFEQAIKIIEREIVVLQRLLQEGEPVRLWTNHPRRFKWLA